MQSFESESGYVVIRLDPGDLVLESILSVCEKHNIKTGAVISGIGTFRNLHIHYFKGDGPADEDGNIFIESNEPWEITGIEGVIADGEPHLHVTAFNGDQTIAGHLEKGNETNALGEVLIRKIDDLDLIRSPNKYDIPMLEERDGSTDDPTN